MLENASRLSLAVVSQLIKKHSDADILSHYRQNGYDLRVVIGMLNRVKIKAGIKVPRP